MADLPQHLDSGERPYDGPVGKTRLDAVEIPKVGGGTRVVEVYRSIDVAARPDLAERARAGQLHVLPDGEALAVSYVFHDPRARRFALVLPEALRDAEYGERSALLAQLAADVTHPIPGYVRDFALVFGLVELETYLSEPTRAELIDARERALDERERLLASLEAELDSRKRALETEPRDAEPSLPDPREEASADPPLSDFDVSLDSSSDLISSVRAVAEVEAEHLGSATEREVAPALEPPPKRSSRRPPSGRPGVTLLRQMVAFGEGDGLRLTLPLAPDRGDDFFADGADLRVQYAPTEGHPLVLLTLVEERPERPESAHVARLALDPRAPEARAHLESLRSRFAATVEIVGADEQILRTFEVSSARHTNVAMILSRVDRHPPATADTDIGWVTARTLESPPPLDSDEHPFHRADAAFNAREASIAVRLLGRWSQPAQLEAALLVLSVPHEVVDDSFRRVLADAIDHGVALPARLIEKAVDLGIATDAASLVKREVDAFRGTAMLPDRGSLGVEEVALNWQRLFEMAHEHAVDIDADVLAAAKGDVSRGRMGGAAVIDISTMPNMEVEELILLLDHPEVRADAAIELLVRRDPYVLDPVCASLKAMGRRDISRVVPRMVPMGGVAGEKLVKGLSAQKPFARQAALLALGELRHRPAIEPILRLMRHEPSEVWEEAARVISAFGREGFRALRRHLGDLLGPEERFAEALAHFMDAGLEDEVLRMQQNENLYLAQVAEVAVRRLAGAREKAGVARDERPCSSADVLRAFSQHFYRQLGDAVAPPPV